MAVVSIDPIWKTDHNSRQWWRGKNNFNPSIGGAVVKRRKAPCDSTERELIKVIYQAAEDGLWTRRYDQTLAACRQLGTSDGTGQVLPCPSKSPRHLRNRKVESVIMGYAL